MFKAWKMVLLLFTFLLIRTSQAEKVQEGKLTLSGSIYSAACGISSESKDQTINFGRVSARREFNTRSSRIMDSNKNFTLKLENCDAELLKSRSVVAQLSGTPSQYDSRMLAVSGDAKGVAIEISDKDNRTISPGSSVNIDSLISSENKITLNTSLHIYSKWVGAGEFSSTAQLTLRYI